MDREKAGKYGHIERKKERERKEGRGRRTQIKQGRKWIKRRPGGIPIMRLAAGLSK